MFGRRFINGKAVSGDKMLPAAFVMQEVEFFPHMTVRETLEFRAQLELSNTISASERDELVTEILRQLGLVKVSDSVVGNAKVRGISGGEKKRLSIALEMVSAPSLVLLDEPTSGLDASSAAKVIEALRRIADSGKTVIAVIHQPSQHIFQLFDDLLLVSEGKQFFFGERKDVRSYMSKNGCLAGTDMGTAEHALDCITRESIFQGESQEDSRIRFDTLAQMALEQKVDFGQRNLDSNGKAEQYIIVDADMRGPRASLFTQCRLLFLRAFRGVFRSKSLMFMKLVQQITMAVIYGGIYTIGSDQASIQDRFGLLSLITIGSTNMAVASSIRAFPREKSIVASELASKMYHSFPYFVAKALSELPMISFLSAVFGSLVYHLTGLSKAPGKFRSFLSILALHGIVGESTGLLVGAVSPNSDVALAVFPAILVINIIFDGKNIAEESVPKLLRWVPQIGLIRWGFEGLCINEFAGLLFDRKGLKHGPSAETGQDALARLGLGSRSIADVLRAQATTAASFYAISFLGLTLTRQRYETMNVP